MRIPSLDGVKMFLPLISYDTLKKVESLQITNVDYESSPYMLYDFLKQVQITCVREGVKNTYFSRTFQQRVGFLVTVSVTLVLRSSSGRDTPCGEWSSGRPAADPGCSGL